MPSWEKALLALWPVALVGLLISEAVSECVRSWFVDHALSAGVVSGGLLLGPPLLLIERHLERSQRARDSARQRANEDAVKQRETDERARWKRPAQDAIETYLYTAHAFTVQLGQRLHQTARDLGSEPEEPTWPGDWWEAIADRADADTFLELNEFIHDAASRSGAVAIGATSTLALYTPLSSYVDRISEVQRQTRAIAAQCNELSHVRQMGNPASLSEFRADTIKKLGRHTENRAELLAGIDLDLDLPAPPLDLPLLSGEDQP